jgi:hypothetical protein
MDLAGSAYLAASAPLPAAVPDYALQAATVYRLEVGAACFVVIYLAAMAFFLALDGRGFAEFGTRGLKAEQIVRAADDEQEVTLTRQMELQQEIEQRLDGIDAVLGSITEDLEAQKQRLQFLERRR